MHHPLLQYTNQIAKKIDNILTDCQKQSQSEFEKELLESVKKMAVSGKMVRGNLVVASAKALGFAGTEEILIQVAAGIELADSGILVLDDVIDQDTQRRGAPTIHKIWQNEAEKQGWSNPIHTGESLALCLNHTMIQLGMLQMCGVPVPGEIQGKLSYFSNDFLVKLGLAEAHEFQVALTNEWPKLAQVEQLYIDKTANYTIVWSLLLGGTIAQVADDTLVDLTNIGQQIGIAFQIRDDWLNIYGDPAVTGKSTLSDITNRKKTWMLFQLLDFVDKTQGQRLTDLYSQTELSRSEIDEVHQLFLDDKFQTYLTKQVDRKKQAVQDIIQASSLPEQARELLNGVLELVINRNK